MRGLRTMCGAGSPRPVADAPEGVIALVTTSPYQVALFLRSHLQALPAGVEVMIFTNTTDTYGSLARDMEMHHVSIGRERRLTLADVAAGVALARFFRARGVDSVFTMSPKAGFIGQAAAAACGIERRAHVFTGQVWADMVPGVKRVMARGADRAIGRLANDLAADSPSQAEFLVVEGIAPSGKPVTVPHPSGSIRGVDLSTFRPRDDARAALRAEHKVDSEAVAFVQLGRLARSKGVMELAEAFAALRLDWLRGHLKREPRLFLVGPDEEGLAAALETQDGVIVLPFTPEPERLLAAMDVLVLASHREGFGSTVIEAAAVGIPAIATDIVGVRDAVVDGATGWLFPVNSTDVLRAIMSSALLDEAERKRRGALARQRVQCEFDAATVSAAYANFMMTIHRRRR